MLGAKPADRLVEDVKRIVVQNISIPSDLQALCLVSREWNFVATEVLYKNIFLHSRGKHDQLLQFENCLRFGAANLLRHARSLSLYDTVFFDEWNMHYKYAHQEEGATEAAIARQEAILRVMQLFPHHRLITFRYTSDVPLSTFCLEHLSHYQTSIQNMHNASCNPLLVVGHQRRNLTAGFHDNGGKTLDFVQFAKYLSPTESLSLIFEDGWNVFVSDFWQEHVDPLLGQTIQTKALTFSGYLPLSFTAKVCQLFDLAVITNLRLVDVNFWLLLDNLAPSVDLCNLTSFQCSTLDTGPDDNLDVLHDLFARNRRLEHVYLSVGGLEHRPICSPEELDTDTSIEKASYLWPLRSRLRSLAWHDSYPRCLSCYGMRCSVPYLRPSWLNSLCSNFTQLRQLGLQGEQPPNLLRAELATGRGELLVYLKPIAKLKHLQILHLYQRHLTPGEVEIIEEVRHVRSAQHVFSDIRNFASALFEWAHVHCPTLKVLVWGEYTIETATMDELSWILGEAFDEYAPQFIFVKKESVGQDGGKRIAASLTTRSRFRDDFPRLDLLTYDPGIRGLDLHALHA